MTTSTPPASNWKLNAARIGALVLVIAISVGVYLLRDQVVLLQTLGYPGIFFINLLGSATIVLPAPGLAIVFGIAAIKSSLGVPVFNPFWIGVAAGLGATFGELSGYAAGFSGQAIIEKTSWYDRVHGFTKRYGVVTILVLSILPLPIFDLAGLAAGTLKMPLSQFFIATLIGKLIKMWFVAWAGASGVAWARPLFE